MKMKILVVTYMGGWKGIHKEKERKNGREKEREIDNGNVIERNRKTH